MSFYLQDSDYEVAEMNGIDRETLYQRVYIRNWPVLKALTTPKQTRKILYPDYQEQCEANGISRSTFNERVRRGATPEDAASKPVERTIHFKKRESKLSQGLLKQAEANGIPAKTVSMRVYGYKWDVQRAITEPIHTQYRRKS
jgi:hypothetical protein